MVGNYHDKHGFKSWWDSSRDAGMGYHPSFGIGRSHHFPNILIGVSWDIRYPKCRDVVDGASHSTKKMGWFYPMGFKTLLASPT